MPTISKKFLVNVDLQKNQLENAVVHKSTVEPSSPVAGQLWYDSGNNKLKYYDGSNWISPTDTEGHTYALSGSGVIVKLTQDSGTIGNAGSYEIPAATTSSSGVMTTTQVTKLNGIADNANNYTHPSHTAKSSGLYKVTVDSLGHVSAATAVQKSDITALGIPAQDTTYSVATSSANGLMSSTDKSKLDSLTATMQFKGTLGTDSTATYYGTGDHALPAAASSNKGWTVKVIALIDSPVSAKNGDMLISDGTSWLLIPSADDPSGTVTSIGFVNNGGIVNSSGTTTAITTSGSIKHTTGSGWQHLPTGGASTNVLRWAANNAGTWDSVDTTVTTNSNHLVTSGAVKTAIGAIVQQELISRATITIGTGTDTGTANIGSGYTIYAVTPMQGGAGVVADWSYSGNTVTVTLANNPSSEVTINILYYKGTTIPNVSQASYVVDENSQIGTNEKWKWRKWSNGEVELWGRCYHYNASFSSNGNAFFSPSFQETFPSGLFSEAPFVCMMDIDESSAGVAGVDKSGAATATKTQTYWAYRVDSAASVSFWTQVYAKGRWQ